MPIYCIYIKNTITVMNIQHDTICYLFILTFMFSDDLFNENNLDSKGNVQ